MFLTTPNILSVIVAKQSFSRQIIKPLSRRDLTCPFRQSHIVVELELMILESTHDMHQRISARKSGLDLKTFCKWEPHNQKSWLKVFARCGHFNRWLRLFESSMYLGLKACRSQTRQALGNINNFCNTFSSWWTRCCCMHTGKIFKFKWWGMRAQDPELGQVSHPLVALVF